MWILKLNKLITRDKFKCLCIFPIPPTRSSRTQFLFRLSDCSIIAKCLTPDEAHNWFEFALKISCLQKQKSNIKNHVVYSQKPCRNEYGIGDQCLFYWLLLFSRSNCANHCVTNNAIKSRERTTLRSNCCGWALCMLLRTDYWWVTTDKTRHKQ